jgi:hypothetical protein
MKIIPYEKFQIDSVLSAAEVLQQIEHRTGEKKLFSFRPSHEFSGHVNEREFEITKNISYRNSFLPVIEGDVEQLSTGARVTILMRLHFAVICFMIIWFTGVSIGCVAVLTHLDRFSMPMLIPFGMLIFGVLIVSGGFWFEASKQKLRLIELLSKN